MSDPELGRHARFFFLLGLSHIGLIVLNGVAVAALAAMAWRDAAALSYAVLINIGISAFNWHARAVGLSHGARPPGAG